MKICKFLKRIYITPGFLCFLCAYYYFDPAGSFSPFLLGAAAHESGHLLLCHLLHRRIHRIRLSLQGACITVDPLPYRQELLIATAGPAVNMVLFFLFLHEAPPFALLNLGLCLYNLLPFYPLDGGRILRALLHLLLQDDTALLVERCVGGFCLGLLFCFCVYLSLGLQSGLWPVLLFGLLLLRIGGTIFPKFPLKS